jgi:hypothetical protein
VLQGERGAQLVGGVRDELPLRLEGGFQALEQIVQRGTEPAQLVVGEPAVEIACGDSAGGVGAFAACMRSHGEPNMPEPNNRGQLSINGIDPNSPQLQSAEKDCQKLDPSAPPPTATQQARAQSQALKFAACVRKHGLPDFPDPTFSHGNIGQGGFDPNSDIAQTVLRRSGRAPLENAGCQRVV